MDSIEAAEAHAVYIWEVDVPVEDLHEEAMNK
jgi:hypothetical protein